MGTAGGGLETCWMYVVLWCRWSVGQPAHTAAALTLYRLWSTPPPPPPLSLLVSALLARICCVSQAASRQQTLGERKHGLRSPPYARSRGRIAGAQDFSLFPTCRALCLKIIPDLTPTATLLVWMVDCTFDGAEQACLIEGLRPGGHLWGRVTVNGLRSLADFLQSLWVICGRRWRTGLRCFPYPLSIPSLLLAAGKSSRAEDGEDGARHTGLVRVGEGKMTRNTRNTSVFMTALKRILPATGWYQRVWTWQACCWMLLDAAAAHPISAACLRSGADEAEWNKTSVSMFFWLVKKGKCQHR